MRVPVAGARSPGRILRTWYRLPVWVRRPVRWGLFAALGVTLLAAVPYGWTQTAAAGHLYDESDVTPTSGPRVDVLLILGAEVAPGGAEPMPFLKGRLDTAGRLLADGYAKVALVSGDAHGGSGDETSVMSAYLTRVYGIDPSRLVIDPDGLDTYDSCVRASRVYGLTRVTVVTQSFHLSRAVALCRHAGIDADGVRARCDGCGLNVVRNAARDYLACTKVALDVLRDRDPVVISAPSSAVADAVALAVITVDDVRTVCRPLPRSSEHLIRDRVKFRVGAIVYVAFSRDETTMGFGYPRDERDELIASAPDRFFLPRPSELRFQWVQAWTAALDLPETRELVIEAWRLCVPKKISALVPQGRDPS